VSVFDSIRDQVALDRILSANGSGKTRCVAPDHQDNSPSMHVYADHVHCFVCGFHGDVADVWAAMRGFDRPIDAALDLAREFGIKLPEIGPETQQKAHKRREKEDLYLRQAQACHRALENHRRVREWWEGRGFGPELRERFLLGTDKDGTAAVIPFWHRGRVQGLIRRKLEGEPRYQYPKIEEFSGGYRPLFIPGSAREGAFLVEGIVDALALAVLGESAIAVGGTGISREQMRELENFAGPFYILFDADEEGEQAARKLVRELYPKALVCTSEFGDGLKDVADLFRARGEDARVVLEGLRAGADDALSLELSDAPKGSNSLGAYRTAKDRILPLLLRLEDEGERDAALHDVAGQLKLSIKPMRKALAGLVQHPGETQEEERVEAEDTPRPGTKRYEQAIELLEDRRLLSRAASDMKRLGHVGEFAAKKLALICAVSARSGKPIQPSTHAQSAAGKNFLWDTTLSLLPTEMVVKRSGLSAKALFRTQANLKGAVLYIQEISGSEDAEYTIRVMQSDGRLEYEATEKMPDGSMKNVVYQTEGPTVVVQTTTRNHLHPENETRVFPIYIDESEEQTGRIVGSLLKEASGSATSSSERESICRRWHDAIRLLEPGEVVLPYAERIEIPSAPLRIRRDARRLIDVVRVIAWLHQHQRERDAKYRILATEGDFAEALELVSESLRRAWQTLTPAEETVLRTILELPEQLRSKGFRRRDLKVKGVSDRRVKEVLKSLTDTVYLDCDGRAGPQGYTYTLAREAEKISLGISLRPPPDSQESPANNENNNGREAFARYRPVPGSEEEVGGHRESGATGRNGHRPIEDADLQEERATGRTGGEVSEEKIFANGELSAEEAKEVERLTREGMARRIARAVVLGRVEEELRL
jgi:DNA primase